MTRRTQIIILSVVAVALLASIPLVLRYRKTLEARRAISAYDAALVRTLRELNPDLLGMTALPREKLRVTNYVSLLYGRERRVDGQLLSLDIESVQAAEPTVTVIATERWRYVERDKASDKVVTKPVTETNKLNYTLVRDGGVLRVYLSEFSEDAGHESAGQ